MKLNPILICLCIFKITLSYADTVYPQMLQSGDTVGLIASSSTVDNKNEICNAKKNLEEMGFKVILGKHIFDDYDDSPTGKSLSKKSDLFKTQYSNVHINLAGSDESRAADIMSMFENHNIKAIIEFRGGYGSGRLLHNYLITILLKKIRKL